MKKVFLLLLATLFMSTTCDRDDEPVFSSDYFIQNSSSFDLYFITEDAGEILIESQSRQFIASTTNLNSFVIPSLNIAFNDITLYRKDSSGYLLITYEQEPIVDNLWSLNTLSNYEVEYVLIITDEILN